MMTKDEIDQIVWENISTGMARTQGELLKKVLRFATIEELPALDSRTIDNSLRRLKTKGRITFDRKAGDWVPNQDVVPTVAPSSLSAPTGDSEVQSDGEAAPPQSEEKESQIMTTKSTDVAQIDSELAAAKSKAKSKPADAPSGTKRPRLTAEEKAARETSREAEKASKKAERDAARATKKAERDASRKPAHMSKVDKAASKLPGLNDEAQELFTNVTANFGREQLAALAAHLNHFNRTKATERALSQKVSVGDQVRIVSGDARFIGMTGEVAKAQRIRCYVTVAGAKKPVYLFTSDVEVVKAAPVAKTA